MATINGTSSDDTLNGTVDPDTINGLDGSDFIQASDGDDTINGGAGNDYIYGGLGNDTIDGGAGQDIMRGDEGNDTYVVDNASDVVYEASGQGSDNILSSVSYYLPTYVEKLTLTGTAAIDGTGNDANNILVGNGAANTLLGMGGNDTLNGSGGDDTLSGADGTDVINGGAGNDVIQGGAGNDQLTGGTGTDTFKFQIGDGSDTITDLAAGDSVMINGYAAAQSIVQSGTDVIMTLSGSETLTFSNTTVAIVQAAAHFDGGVVLTGTFGGDILNGTEYHDVISGGYGWDTINGFGGDDTLDGDADQDAIYGGDGKDTINGGAGNDYLFGDAGDDIIHGGTDHDVISDGAGNDTAYGDADSDTFIGSPGDDTYDGGSTVTTSADTDIVDYVNATAGIVADLRLASDQVHSAAGGDAAGIGVDTLIDIEGVSGSNFNDVITANNDVASRLSGAGGDDVLTGSTHADSLNGGAGDDHIDGGAGVDEASYAGAASGVTVSLAISGAQDTGGAGTDTLINIENLVGTQFSDVLTGDDSDNEISGHSGDPDTISGGGGNDILEGGEGSHLSGGDGNDTLYAINESSETIEFHAGDDKDVVYGIAYNDVVEIHDYLSAQSIAQVGNDIVVKFSDTDQITFKSSDMTSVQASLRFVDLPRPAESLTAPITSTRPADVVLSPDGATLYVADTDGAVRVYDLATRTLETTWQVGNELGGIDVSPDGTYLLVTEREPVSHQPATSTTDASTTITTYKITVATGDIVSLPMDVPGNVASGFYDVEILTGGHARVSQEMYNYPIRDLDVSTGQYSQFGQSFGGYGVLVGANDHASVAFTSQNQSPPEIAIYSPTERLAYWAGYSMPDSAPASGILAYSAEAGLLVQQQYSVSYIDTLFTHLMVFNAALDQWFDLNETHPEWIDGRISGLAFDATGANLFVLDDDMDTIVQVSTSDWSTVRSFNVGADIGDFAEGDFGNRLQLTADGRYFIVVTATGIQLVANDALANHFAGTTGDDHLSAGLGDDDLSGLQGNDQLKGDSGDDTLMGGAGNDQLDGGAGNDTASYSDASAGVSVNLALTHAQNTIGAGLDTLSGIENLGGSDFDDTLRGDAGSNQLDGRAGDDYLYGNAGNDQLTGGSGYDRMYGGLGDDRYLVSDATDFAYENAGEGHDTVQASVDCTLRANVEDLILWQSAVIGKGNELDNVISGSDIGNKLYGLDGNDRVDGGGGDDYIFGGNGNDTMSGGAGYDRMYGGVGDDIYYVNDTTDYAYENLGEGYDKVISSLASYQLRANVEELDLAEGSAAIRGYGQDDDNKIVGNSADNFLYGRDGNDWLQGNGGNDILYGENGNDTLLGGAGMDRFYGGSGQDKFVFRNGDFAGMTSTTADRIHDFSEADGDIIHLSGVDANLLVAGDQSFAFVGSAAFSHNAGELRAYQQSGVTYVAGDTNGDGVADFLIRIDGVHTLTAADFIL